MRKILYLGLDLPPELHIEGVTHYPLIKVVPHSKEAPHIVQAFNALESYTHLIFTSKTAVRIFFDYTSNESVFFNVLKKKCFLSIGQKTTQELNKYGIGETLTAREETSEGMIALLNALDLKEAFIFWPHSALSRPLISQWLEIQNLKHHSCILYNTISNLPLPSPDLSSFDEIIFTSPSIVDAFFSFFGRPDSNKKLTFIGPVTHARYNDYDKVERQVSISRT